MAQAKDVRLGQVWTARVSGAPAQVEILSEIPGPGRKRFLYKNLKTGRTGKGGAGRFKQLVRDMSPHGSPAAPVAPLAENPAPPAPPPPPPRRTPPRTAPRANPTHYPSTAAEAAAVALSRSRAMTPHEVVAVVQQAMGFMSPYDDPLAAGQFDGYRDMEPDTRERVLREVYATDVAAWNAARAWARKNGGEAVGTTRSRSGYSPVVRG